uniref:Uncharacterized protein n=2 Tax=Lygus hesperus TaxID=30085 RepID=A0A0A9WCS5_LYGHE
MADPDGSTTTSAIHISKNDPVISNFSSTVPGAERTYEDVLAPNSSNSRGCCDPPTAKRKRSPKDKEETHKKLRESHPVRPPCTEKCLKGCTKKISEERRTEINSEFWLLNFVGRSSYVLSHTEALDTKNKLKNINCVKSSYYKYFLKEKGKLEEVCRTFFLTTLGFTPTNNTLLKRVLNTSLVPENDKRGKHSPPNKCDTELIQKHIRSLNPGISQYRRKLAPNRLYVTSELTIKKMHSLFKEAHPSTECSYQTYLTQVSIVQNEHLIPESWT